MNISLNNEDISLKKGKEYMIIDSLYLNDIKEKINILNLNNLEIEIREKVFIYNDTPFAKYYAKNSFFGVSQIKKKDFQTIQKNDKSVFATDTGLIIFLQEEFLKTFLNNYNYDDLVDSIIERINIQYWKQLMLRYNDNDFGLILSSGSNSKVEFEGSGLCYVKEYQLWEFFSAKCMI